MNGIRRDCVHPPVIPLSGGFAYINETLALTKVNIIPIDSAYFFDADSAKKHQYKGCALGFIAVVK